MNVTITSLIERLDGARADLRAARSGLTAVRKYRCDHMSHDGRPEWTGEAVEIVGGVLAICWENGVFEIAPSLDVSRAMYPSLQLVLTDSGNNTLLRDRLLPEQATGPFLTQTELKVIRAIGRGLSNKEIARELNLAQSTIKNCLVVIFSKLDVFDRTQLAIKASDMRLVPGFLPDDDDSERAA